MTKDKPVLPSKIDHSRLYSGLIIMSLVLSVVVFLMFSTDKISRLLVLRDQISQNSQNTASLEKVVSKIDAIDKAGLGILLSKATAALPGEKKASGVVAGFTKLAADSVGVVKTIELYPGLISTQSASKKTVDPLVVLEQSTGAKAIPASVSLVMGIDQMIDLLTKLKRSSQIITVQSLKYSAKSVSEQEFGLSILIHYQPEKNEWNLENIPDPITDGQRQMIESLPPNDIFKLP